MYLYIILAISLSLNSSWNWNDFISATARMFICSDLWPGRGGSCFSSLLALCSFDISSTILAGMGSGPAFEILSSSRLLWLRVWIQRQQSRAVRIPDRTSNYLTDSTDYCPLYKITSFVSIHIRINANNATLQETFGWFVSLNLWIKIISQMHLLKGRGQPICFFLRRMPLLRRQCGRYEAK